MTWTRWALVPAVLLLPVMLQAQSNAGGQAVATVDGIPITADDLRQAAGQQLANLEQQAYAIKRQKLDEVIADRLLAREARRRNVSVEALVQAEISSQVAPVTAEEVHAFYEGNKSQLRQSEAELQEPIRNHLREQRAASARATFVESLKAGAKVSIALEAPPLFRVAIKGDGPNRGPAAPLVTIVAFEDFHCPFCKQVNQALERVLTRYKDTVRLVHRDLPLPQLHPAARKAHEAARCADRQGKFWEYRGVLYQRAPAASAEQLNSYAAEVGLNLASFKSCLESEEARAAVQRDEAEARRLGITGTPAFYINGRFLAGAQPESEFARLIDEELAARASR